MALLAYQFVTAKKYFQAECIVGPCARSEDYQFSPTDKRKNKHHVRPGNRTQYNLPANMKTK